MTAALVVPEVVKPMRINEMKDINFSSSEERERMIINVGWF